MKHSYLFYHEFTDKTKAVSHQSCLAVRRMSVFGQLAPAKQVLGQTDDGVIGETVASDEYLGRFCELVSESDARAIHPALFNHLDNLAA